MHVSGVSLDLSPIIQLVLTLVVVGFGLIHLVKKTASKYFVVDANFESSSPIEIDDHRGRDRMAVAANSCFVCGTFAKKWCSRCKAVWYCSFNCQSKHWNDHKLKCKELKLVDSENSMPSASSKRRKALGWAEDANSTLSLVPARGSCKALEQPKKVLFPYDEFVKLFNWDKPGFPPCGLLNCGNSCFANVVLQCLACTRPLIAYLLEKGHTNECKRNDWCFLCELQLHVCRVSQSLNPFSPINILSRLPNIGGNLGYGKQEDAHEFMRFAIDTMQSVCLDEFGGEKALSPSTQETTLIQHTFGGYLQSQVKCSKCNQISNRYENMMDLTVEIQGDAASLEDCLDQFTVKEWLDGENMYKCDGCNDYVKAWKRLTVHQAPNILTVALKRFQSGRFGKLNKRVIFPETLDLGPYMNEAGDGTHLYKLYAVVVHVDMLNASYFGHYICYTKDFGGNWYRIDDCKVMKVELEEVLAQGAYMLLYSRICVRQPCVKPLEPTRKEERKTMEVVHEAVKCGLESVESPSFGELMESVSSPEILSSDLHLQSTDSSHGREFEDVDMNDPIKVNSEPIGEETEDVDMMSNPESSSVVSKDLGEWYLSDHSHAIENVLPDKILHRDKLGESADSVMSSGLSIESDMVESQESGSNSIVDCSFEEENSLRGNWDKESQLRNSPNPSPEMTEMPKASYNVSVALKSEMEPPDEAGLSQSPLDFRLEQEATANNNSSVSSVGISKPGKVSPANGNARDKASILAGDNCSFIGQSKSLFSPGFLDKPARRNSLHKDKKAQIETGEIGSSSMVNGNCNGAAESLHSVRPNGIVYNHDGSVETIHEKGGAHILDHRKPVLSPGILDKPAISKSLNKEEVTIKEMNEVVQRCNTDCNGFYAPVFSDENGGMTNYQEDARLETCESDMDLVLDRKPLLSSGFLNKRTGKKGLWKDAEAPQMGQGSNLSILESNCDESADSIFGDQDGNEYRASGMAASICENAKGINSIRTPGFFDNALKMKLQNESQIAQKEPGGVGQSAVSKH